jgi:uridylate kinase
LYCPEVAQSISKQTIDESLRSGNCIIFAGGTGNPYFTTDTNAILRALEIGATQVWKGTSVDGVYTADPRIDPSAKKLNTVTYQQALENNLAIMDTTAFTLARDNGLTVRVFDIFEHNALVRAAQDPHVGTIIQQ